MLKYLPEWLIWAQANGTAEAMIRLANSDEEVRVDAEATTPLKPLAAPQRSEASSDCVEPQFRTLVNLSRTEPKRIDAPSTSRVADSTRRSDTNVPFLLLRSSMLASLPSIVIRA